jgi:hypothetical protein
MKILFFLLIFPIILQASEVRSVNNYLTDINFLESDLSKIDNAINSNLSMQNRREVEKLRRNLTEFKIHSNELNNSKSLDSAINFSISRGWVNTSEFLNRIKSTCSNFNSSQNECFIKLADFDQFIDTRKISNADKIHFHQLIDVFGKYVEAKIIINDSFVKDTDELIRKNSALFVEFTKPLAVVKIIPIKNLKKILEVVPKKINKNVLVQSNLVYLLTYAKNNKSFISNIGIAIFSFICIAVMLIFFTRKRIKKQINHFYSSIFYIAHKKNIKMKIFGHMNVTNIKKLKIIEKSYLELINSSSVFKSDLNIRIKNKEQKLILEMVVYIDRPIQEWFSLESCAAFQDKLLSIEKDLSGVNGELHISSIFDNHGAFINSNLTVVL